MAAACSRGLTPNGTSNTEARGPRDATWEAETEYFERCRAWQGTVFDGGWDSSGEFLLRNDDIAAFKAAIADLSDNDPKERAETTQPTKEPRP